MTERFYKEGVFEGRVSLEGKEHHHLAHVMRISPGEEIELVNGQGAVAKGQVVQVGKERTEVAILSLAQQEAKAPLILAQAAVRRSKLEWIVEKGTELGITEFWLYPAEKGEKSALSPADHDRLLAIRISALKQSGQLFLPKLLLKDPIKKWQDPLHDFFFGDVRKEAPPLLTLKGSFNGTVIGPESGFSDAEVSHLEALKAKGASITSSVLRTESAAVAASTLLAHLRHTRSASER